MKVLQILYYYYPHCSGLTIYVERLGRHLAERGHEVTVLASRHDPTQPREETQPGVRVIRVPVVWSVSRGVVMPGFIPKAAALIREHDVVHLHLPVTEAAAIAGLAKAFRKRLIITHHTDLSMPIGKFNKVAEKAVFASGIAAGKLADRIVTYTHDRATVSPFASRFKNKMSVVYPPIEIDLPDPQRVAAFRASLELDGAPTVGFAGRFAEEKGCDYLLRTIPRVNAALPGVKYLFAGEYLNVVGDNLFARSQPLLQQFRQHVRLLGVLRGDDLVNFYAGCDVTTLPSVNFTETFGIVQVESMLCGTPVVTSDLPGVREPIGITGMGKIVPPRDETALADALIDTIQHRERFVRPRAEIAAKFSLDATIDAYERIYAGDYSAR